MQLSQMNLQTQTSEISHKVYQQPNATPFAILISIYLPLSPPCPLQLNSPQQKMPLKESGHLFLSNTTLKQSKLDTTLCTTIKIFLHGKKRLMRNQKDIYAESLHRELFKMPLVKVQFVSLNVIEPHKEVEHLVDVTWCLLTELFFLMRQNMLLRIRAHIIRSFCSCKCMWR